MSDATRALSFGAAAAAYHRSRTGYDSDDVAWALSREDGRGPAGLDVLDLAAGTGRLTAALVAAGAGRVEAVEPDAAMRAEAARHLPVPPVTLHDGTAEAVPLPDASVDAAVAGSAFHWFDPARALPEIARVLRPGGTLAALWTSPDDEVDWVRTYRGAGREVLRAGLPEGARSDRRTGGPDRHRDIAASPLFTATELRVARHVEAVPLDSLTAAIGTYSDVLVADPAVRAAALAAVADAVDRVVPAEVLTDSGRTVLLPVRVRGARCRLR